MGRSGEDGTGVLPRLGDENAVFHRLEAGNFVDEDRQVFQGLVRGCAPGLAESEHQPLLQVVRPATPNYADHAAVVGRLAGHEQGRGWHLDEGDEDVARRCTGDRAMGGSDRLGDLWLPTGAWAVVGYHELVVRHISVRSFCRCGAVAFAVTSRSRADTHV